MADQKEKERRDRELADFAWVLGDARGRAVIRRLIAVECRVYGSVTAPNPGLLPEERILYNAGRQDVGHMLVNECALADPSGKLYQTMNQEAHNRLLLEKNEREQKKPKEEDNG
jgi:hypothetical protein